MPVPASPRRITIVGYYGFRNAGDEVILGAMLRDLRRRSGLAITVASATPAETAETHGVESFLWSDTRALMTSVESTDLVIVGGGGLFHDSFGFDPDAFLTDQQTGIAYYTAPVFLAALSGKPAMLYAVGGGPLLSEQGKLFTRIAGELATAITVRDEGSRNLFASLGVPEDKIEITADPAFSFASNEAHAQRRPGTNERIAVSVRHWDRDIAPAFWERELARALDLIVDRRNADIAFLPFQHLEGQAEDDAAVACRIRKLMRQGERASVLPHSLHPDAIVAELKNCRAAVAMRLHSAILSLCAGLPVVALSYEPKVSQAMARAGLADRTIDLRAFDAARLVELVEQALDAGPPDIARNLDALAAGARRNAEVALNLLENKRPPKPSLAGAMELLPRIVRTRVEEAFAARTEHRRCVADVATLMARVRELDAEIDQRGSAIQALSARLEESARELRDLAAARDDFGNQLSARTLELAQARAAHEQLRVAHGIELEQLRTAHARVTEQLRAQAAAESEAARATISTLREQTENLLRERTASAEAWAEERESLQAARSGLAQELESQRAENRRQTAAAQEEIAALAKNLDRLSQELADARRTAVHQADEWDKERQSLMRSGEEQRTLTRRLHSLTQALEGQFEETRQAVLAGANRYDRDFQAQLGIYRNQRAWQLMLLARKAYTLIQREGWKGRFDCVGLAFKTIARAPLELAPYDLTFPPVFGYLPEKVFVPSKPSREFESLPEAEPTVENPPLDSPVPSENRLYDVLVFPVFDFEFRFQRPQQFAAELARRGHRVFWISPSRRLPEDSAEAFKIVELRNNLYEAQLRRPAIDLYGGSLAEGQESMAVESLAELCRERNVAESAILLQFPFWRRIGKGLAARAGASLVYDQMDDWRNWPSEPRISAFNIEEEDVLARECDVLVVTSGEFARRWKDRRPAPCVIPNAADFDFFHSAPVPPTPSERPVIGYYGAIAAWFDLDLAIEVAAARPQYDFVFIGGVHGRDVSALERFPNVRLLGEKHYRELPSLLAGFDVCLIPFAINRLTHTVDPVKVYEYLSQGKPVVATNMTELAPLSDILYLAQNPGDFTRAIDRAVVEKERIDAAALRAERIAFARRNTWQARVDILCHAVDATFPMVSIVVLTHNSQDYVGLCAESIRRNTAWPRYELVFVDNASTDQTVEKLRSLEKTDGRIRVIALSENTGFAAGNNIGVRESAGEYLVILNPDTVLCPGWLQRLIQPLRNDSTLGLIAPVTNHSGNETRIDFDYRGLEEMEAFAAERARRFAGRQRELTMAALFCVAMRRELWNEIGELDERFRVGMFEDDDYSRRVRAAGYRIATAEDCFVHHFGSGSFAQIQPEESLRIFASNRRLYETKWGEPWQEHRSRDNVRPLASAMRFSPRDFRATGWQRRNGASRAPSLVRLLPDRTAAGQPMNRQPDGAAALVVDCARATPDTVIRWNDVLLTTSFASPEFVTAIVPAELYAEPGTAKVTLLNDFGISDAVLFTIQ